jgi:hypothetical protein
MPTLAEGATKIQFATSDEMPHLIYLACRATGIRSNTVYLQHVVCEALSRDLDLPYDALVANLPPARGRARDLIHSGNGDDRLTRMRDESPAQEVG